LSQLPRSTNDLRGLRAARWIRESRPGQLDNSGPAAQRFEQDDAIQRLGLVDTGIDWEAGHSGWKASAIATSEKWAEMLRRAGRDYDVLVVGYVSRFCRNVNIGTTIREQFHSAGATIFFADERILLSDESDWKRWIDLLVEAEHYSRNLQRTMERTYRTKFRTHTDPGGMAPLGFRRSGGTPSVLEVDSNSIGQVVGLFERFALGNVSAEQLAKESGLHVERIKSILRNRVYNGWVQRYGEWVPAAWRNDAPVSDALFEQVAAVRAAKSRGGGLRRTDRVDFLNGLLWCAECGQKLWSEPSGDRYRKRHRSPCAKWSASERLLASTWEQPIRAQLAGLDLSPSTMERVARAFDAPPPMPNEVGIKRIERARRALAERYAAGRVNEAELIYEGQRLTGQLDALLAVPLASGVTPEQAIAYMQDFAATWADAGEREQSDLAHAMYSRIEVRGPEFVGLTLTPTAESHGLALTLPEQVNVRSIGVRVGGEGLEPPTFSV
jgi:DNA invertase Pin-like site-specific DNA recombinase